MGIERIKNIIINLKTKIEECLDITDETEASYIILSECKCDAENLQALAELEQPEHSADSVQASEFTKGLRDLFNSYGTEIQGQVWEKAKQACDIIDQLEAENKRLKVALLKITQENIGCKGCEPNRQEDSCDIIVKIAQQALNEAQSLEVQRWTVDDCSRIFQIPPHMLGSPVCKTCGNTGFLVRTFTGSVGLESMWRPKGSTRCREDETIPCPDCQKPEAGEFTKRARDILHSLPDKVRATVVLNEWILEACDIIDRQTDEIKRLKEAYCGVKQCGVRYTLEQALERENNDRS